MAAMAATERAHRRLEIDSTLALAIALGLWVVLMWLGYPRPNLWLTPHLALAPLAVAATRARSGRRVAALTFIAGVIWALLAVRWLAMVTGPGYVAICAYLALFPLGFVLLLRLTSRRLHLPLVFAVPLIWVAVEYARGLLLTGFPWFLLGHSQPTLMIQIADFAGAYGVSFVVAMTGGLIADLLTQPLFRATPRGPKLGRTVGLGLAAWLVVLFGTLGYGWWRVSQYDSGAASGDAIRVAVVQTDVPQSNKTRPTEEQQRADFAALRELTRQAADLGDVQAIVWPETGVPRPLDERSYRQGRAACELIERDPTAAERLGWWCDVVHYREGVEAAAADADAWLVAGAHAYADSGGEYLDRYNAAFLFSPDGELVDRFDKIHRVPFGEYLPFKQTLPWLHRLMLWLSPYDQEYALTAGTSYNLFRLEARDADGEVSVWWTGTPICFEDVVSYVCRRMMYGENGKRGDLLVNLTNDGWYPGMAEAPQHEQIARFRCIENRVPMARAVNRGVSGFLDSCGRRIGQVEVDGERQLVAGIAAAELRRDGRSTLFGRVGDLAALLCLVATAALVLLSIVAAQVKRMR